MANTLTLNHESEASCYEEQLTANLVGKCRTEELDGVKYLVAKISALNPGVLNGSRGPLLYTPEDTRKAVKSWNEVPLVVYHPTDNEGKPISARADGVVHVGFTKNANYRGKLTVEGWFDVEKTKNTDSRVYDALVNGTPMEVSTGLGTTNEEAPVGSKYLGQLYTHIARNHRPDHLAILPDQRGACSLNDGCGLHVNQEKDVENCGGKGGKPGPCPINSTDDEVVSKFKSRSIATGEKHSLVIAKSIDGKFYVTREDFKPIKPATDTAFHETASAALSDHEKSGRWMFTNNSEDPVCTNCDASGECEECKKKRLKKVSDEAEAVSDSQTMNTMNCGGEGGKPGPCSTTGRTGGGEEAHAAKAVEYVKSLGHTDAELISSTKTVDGYSHIVTHTQNGLGAARQRKQVLTYTVGAGKVLQAKMATGKERLAPEQLWAGYKAVIGKVHNQLSHDDLRTRLTQLLNEKYGTPSPSVFGVQSPIPSNNLWINDIFDKDFVYQDGLKQYRLGYKTDLRNDTVTLSEDAPVQVTVKKSYVANDQREFLRTLNCGGEGGTPGPCPLSSGQSSTSHGSPHLAGLESAMGVQFDPGTAKTVGGRTSVIKRVDGQAAKAAANRVREHLKSRGFSTYQGKTKTSTVHGHSDGTIIEVTLSKRKPIKRDGKAIPGSGDSVLFQHITSGRKPTMNQLSKEIRKQTHNVGLKLVVNTYGSPRKEADMARKWNAEDRKKLVDGLVENSGFETADTWEEGDREVLNGLSDEKLYGLAVAKQTLIDQQSVVNAVGKHVGQHKLEDLPEAVENAFKPFKKKKVDDEDDEMEDDEEEETTNVDSQIRVPRQLTEAEFMKMAPPSIRQDLEYSRAVQNKEKQELIGTITANVSGDELDQAVNYLRTKPLPELRIIANVASKPAAPEYDVNVRRSPNYGGMAVPSQSRMTTNKRPGEGPRPVTIPWGEISKQA